MLAKPQRLRLERDIVRVYKRGRSGGAASLHVKALHVGWPTTRLAIVVSRKVSKKAVVRNRIRRRLSGLVSELWGHLGPGYDIVVTVRSDISEAKAEDLRQQLTKALAVSGALQKETNV